MDISLRYLYNKTLVLVPDAKIADERVAPLHIQWVGSASPKFASHGGFLYFVADESEVPSLPLDPADTFGCVVLESLAEQCRGIPRIVVPDACDLDKLFDFLVREHLLYRDWHDLISNLLVSDASYQELVNATAEFVPRPMYIADASWRMISRVDFEMGEISATWHYQMLHDGLYPYHIVEALSKPHGSAVWHNNCGINEQSSSVVLTATATANTDFMLLYTYGGSIEEPNATQDSTTGVLTIT